MASPGRYTLEALAYEATSQKASVITAPLEVLGGSGSMDRVQVVVVRQALPRGERRRRSRERPSVPLRGRRPAAARAPYPRQPGNRLVVQVTASPAAGTRAPSAVMGLWQGDRRLEQRIVAWDRPEPSGLVRHVGELTSDPFRPGTKAGQSRG